MKKLVILFAIVFAIGLFTSCSGGNEPTRHAMTEASTALKTEPETKPGEYSTDEDGFLTYESELLASERGIDVSSYSGDIDWKKVAAQGIKNAMIRIGGRGYGDEGVLYPDDNSLKNIREAKKNGIKVGGYFYSQAVSADEAAEEAEFAVKALAGESLELPVAYDFEYIEDDDARTDGVKPSSVSTLANAFCKTMKKAGYKATVYGYSEDFGTKYEPEKLNYSDGIWLADYDDRPEIGDNIRIFQYSKDGKVDGIEGSVDLDLFIIEK